MRWGPCMCSRGQERQLYTNVQAASCSESHVEVNPRNMRSSEEKEADMLT